MAAVAHPPVEHVEPEGAEEPVEKLPDFALADWIFALKADDSIVPAQEKAEIREKLAARVKEEKAVGLYERICVGELGWDKDADFVASARAHEEKTVQEFADKIREAEETLGETDVRDIMHERANFYARIGEVDKALESYRQVLAKTSEGGRKIDVVLTMMRLGMFYGDGALVAKSLDEAQTLVEKAGDWDRRNRLKVYDGIWTAAHFRDFTKASKMLIETLSTFAAEEFLEFADFIWYACAIACPALDRVELKEKVMDAPEVIQAISRHPALGNLMTSLYECRYAEFFAALAEVTDQMKRDMFLSPHAGYFCKEMRLRAYSQLLQSYRSVQLSQVATQFGVTVEFVDKELSRFIAAGRLAAKIDKVGGAVETTRAGGKVHQYQQLLRHGDVLLNRVQQLSRVINL